MLARGQQRFDIYCAPCHGRLGDGNGITKKIGDMPAVANLHDKRIVEMPDGEIFNTITYGKNTMGAYGPIVPARRPLGDHRLFARAAIELAWFNQRLDSEPTSRAEINMSSHNETTHLPPPLDLSGWKIAPAVLMVVGGILSVIGAIASFHHDDGKEFGCSWLLSFMFFLTLSLGALIFVFIHHLTDAGWSVATRRFNEHLASLLFPWLAILFLPVAIFAQENLSVDVA